MRARRSKSLIVASAAVAAAAFVAHAETNVVGDKGPSTTTTPYLVPVAAGARSVAVFTVGDTVNPKLDGVTPYRMVGIPDGLGAFDSGDGTLTLLMNHELGGTSGVARVHGSAGAFVSAWKIDKTTLKVVSVNDLIRTIETWNPATQAFVQGTTAFARFCSGDLPAATAFFDAATGLGTTERLYMNGEENGASGRAWAHVVTGPNVGVTTELPRLGKQSWENVVACPAPQTKTIVAGTDDSTPGQVYFYVGTKLAVGTDVQKAGLLNGALYGVVANNAAVEDRPNGIGLAKGVAGAFTLAALPDQSAAGANTETAANAALVTKFLRPEDGAWDPAHPSDYYFVTTDGALPSGRSRLWKLHFADIAAPTAGGTVTMLLDGTEGGDMYDNLCIDRLGHAYLQEDLGGNSKSGKIWRYDFATGATTVVWRHDPARFGENDANGLVLPTAPYNNDEESSGIFDASDLLGPGWFLADVQAHYGVGVTELAEGGQLVALYDPTAVAAPTITAAASADPALPIVGQVVKFDVAASIVGAGTLSYSWDFGDGSAAGVGKSVSHAYSAAGVYTATATVTHVASGKTAQSSVVVDVGRPIGEFDLSIKLDFEHAGKDDLTFKGELPLPAGFDPTGKQVSINVGGVQRTFTMDPHGDASPANGETFKLDVHHGPGETVPAQHAKYEVRLKNGSFQASFADEGLVDQTTNGKPVQVFVTVGFDGHTDVDVLDLVWKAKAGKSGEAK